MMVRYPALKSMTSFSCWPTEGRLSRCHTTQQVLNLLEVEYVDVRSQMHKRAAESTQQMIELERELSIDGRKRPINDDTKVNNYDSPPMTLMRKARASTSKP